MWSGGMDEAQAGIKIVWRNINNPKYADDTTLMAESEEELKNLLMKVKDESGKSWLKRHWCIDQSYGLCGRGRGWGDLG